MIPDVNWWIWGVVLAKIATLSEIQEKWSLRDLLDANEVLQYRNKLEKAEFEKAQKRR